MIFNEDDKNELVGEIIDIFEDDLHNRTIRKSGGFNIDLLYFPRVSEVKLHQEDEESDGVFYGGEEYDNVAAKLKTLLCEWGCINI